MGRWGERDGRPDAAKKRAATTSRPMVSALRHLSVIRFIAPVQQFLLTAMGKRQVNPHAAALPSPAGPASRPRTTPWACPLRRIQARGGSPAERPQRTRK